ncbi:hypothetical protein GV054_07165 [Marinomonas mediterranea]|uniref:hypothetical protein n=1 Tax=Marinomonas mediterranea TaxID=119864 RepID=UPI00234A1844|nr:hypothetical protein [Marinomonas mediterranea]WCN12812.1 hypothetical protein GV054_07165 [Marinomonas mediterranea]
MVPLQFYNVDLIRRLDKKTRRRAVFHTLIDSGILKSRTAVIKVLVVLGVISALFVGPLSVVVGAWVPICIAMPFLLSLLLRSELEDIFKPYLLKMAIALFYTGKVDA